LSLIPAAFRFLVFLWVGVGHGGSVWFTFV
jgi:hypothetical protein